MALSMGWTMKGITPRPIPVVAHFRDVSATWGMALAMPAREKAQMRLIVNPGTITEAKACQTNVSKAANATFLESESFSLLIFVALSAVSANTYALATP